MYSPRATFRVQLPASFPVREMFCGSPEGLRCCWMNEDLVVEAFFLATKEYRPGKGVAGVKAGGAARLWAGQVLEEHCLGWTDVRGAVTDWGSDVKFASAKSMV